ncbi:protein shisa-like-1 [Paramormyrops kingsleyae]|uniref:protein shisa-like-1 n=1 Tax=Paramormyrops kingsleyae TaxID=1676925 RepID=UPI000CD61F16|nr:uncharacterized protein KIAA1644-like isoform X2 [Paramormyrops kingsleyae]
MSQKPQGQDTLRGHNSVSPTLNYSVITEEAGSASVFSVLASSKTASRKSFLIYPRNPHTVVMLCEGYSDTQRRQHSGFHCPRLSDFPDLSYCCWQGDDLKHCCNQSQYQSIMNSSMLENNSMGFGHSSRPVCLLVVLLYGALVMVLMVVDLLWFCHTRGLTVEASALTKYHTCPRWLAGLLVPKGNQAHLCHSNRNLTLPQQKVPQESPHLHGNWTNTTSCSHLSIQKTELSILLRDKL